MLSTKMMRLPAISSPSVRIGLGDVLVVRLGEEGVRRRPPGRRRRSGRRCRARRRSCGSGCCRRASPAPTSCRPRGRGRASSPRGSVFSSEVLPTPLGPKIAMVVLLSRLRQPLVGGDDAQRHQAASAIDAHRLRRLGQGGRAPFRSPCPTTAGCRAVASARPSGGRRRRHSRWSRAGRAGAGRGGPTRARRDRAHTGRRAPGRRGRGIAEAAEGGAVERQVAAVVFEDRAGQGAPHPGAELEVGLAARGLLSSSVELHVVTPCPLLLTRPDFRLTRRRHRRRGRSGSRATACRRWRGRRSPRRPAARRALAGGGEKRLFVRRQPLDAALEIDAGDDRGSVGDALAVPGGEAVDSATWSPTLAAWGMTFEPDQGAVPLRRSRRIGRRCGRLVAEDGSGEGAEAPPRADRMPGAAGSDRGGGPGRGRPDQHATSRGECAYAELHARFRIAE